MQNGELCTRITNPYGSQTSPVILCTQNSVISIRITCLYGSSPNLWFCMQNSAFWSRITSLYRSHNSPVILGVQNSVISIRMTSLYWSQLLSVVFACKTATFGAELQVSIGCRPHLSFCACKTAWLASESLVSNGPIPHLWFSQILVSMDSRPFLSKQHD